MRISDWSSDVCSSDLPVIYGGGGIAIANVVEQFREFVEASQIPTVVTLRALGALPLGHPLLLGMLGMHGSHAANMAVQEADLLIVVGARFDDRATGKLATFAPHARIRSEEHTSELQSLMRISYAVFCLKKKNNQ